MKIKTIKVPKGVRFLSDVKEIQQEFNGDLPHNVVINKQVTGCGGTSLALDNNEKYVVAVHLIDMIKCKVNQVDRYKDILGVYNETTDEQILEYIKRGGKKIMVTYDSVPRLKKLMGEKISEYRLLVDEFHKLISYLGHFKPNVAIKLLENNDDFKSVSYLTATPTNYKYLPKPMRQLDIVEFDWEAKITPEIKHAFVKEGLGNRTLNTILDLYDSTDKEICVFYNSRVSVVSIINNIMKCKPELSIDDFNIMFAQTKENTRYFKKYLKDFKYGVSPDGENNKRLNFISSMGFEGLDFYPNHITNAKPISIVVSDPKLKSMQYDINIEIVQILGRFRANKKTDLFVDNEMIYLWNTQNSDYQLTEEEYLRKVLKTQKEAHKHLMSAVDNQFTYKITVQALSDGKTNPYIIMDGDIPIEHPYSIEAEMSAYNAVHSQSSMLGNIDKDGNVKGDSKVVVNLANLDPNVSTFEIPPLSSEYTKALGRNPSVHKMILEYEEILASFPSPFDQFATKKDHEKAKTRLERFLQKNQLFNEWIGCGVTTSMMHTLGRKQERISQKALQLRTCEQNEDYIIAALGFEIGVIYSRDEIIQRITDVYKKLNIEYEKVKATEIKKWYEIKNSPKSINGKTVSGYKIVSKL